MRDYITNQLNSSYNGQLNELFQEWKKSYPDEADAEHRFCEDGLVIKYNVSDSEYDVNEAWRKSPRKIVFLVKDCPDGWGYDTRRLLTGDEEDMKSLENADNTRNLKSNFFTKIAQMLYGLTYMTKDYLGKDLAEDIKDKNRLIRAFNEIPFAYVECKKIAGGKTCTNSILSSAMERDKEFLKRELNILQPNIIVCCGGGDSIHKFVVDNYFDGLIPNEDSRWEYDYILDDGTNCRFRCKMYYYMEKGVLLFNSYHPSARQGWKIQERVFSPFRRFFNQFDTFDVISVKNGVEK